MRRAVHLMLVGAAPFCSAGVAVAQGKSDPPLVRKEVVLDGLTIALSLPEANAARVSVNGGRIVIDFARNMRLQRLLILTRGKPSVAGPLGPKRDLASAGRLAYRVDDDSGGGSGGPIAELNGVLEFGEVELAVTCTDQSEWSRDPEWCLKFLDRIQLVNPP